jgi:peptidoglycan hydrolase-like protein with peptidoglycan-binding domain
MRRAAALAVLLLAALAPAARAQTPVAPPTPPAGDTAPVETQLSLKLERVGGPRATALAGSRLRVVGTTPVFVPGQTVIVRFYERGKKRGARRATLRPGPNDSGLFMLSYRAEATGPLSVRAFHDATPQLGGLAARAATVDILPRSVRPRSGRASIRALQRRLARLGYVVGERGVFDERTARAVLAFRKVTGMARTTSASIEVMRAIARGKGAFKVRFPEHGRHMEGDLSRQVIALIGADGRVQRIYHTSSGKPSTPTVTGSFKVYLRTPGTNAKGMYDSAYFIGGYATHGYPSVPVFPASHGCFRLPMQDASTVFSWMKIGTPVDVYR